MLGKYYFGNGADPIRLTPAAFAAELGKELALWRDVANKPGMQLR